MLRFDHQGPPAIPKPAATVVVVRETPDGLEIFCVERHRRSGFLGGAIVFPGGQVDPGDGHGCWTELGNGLNARCLEFGDDPSTALAFAVAAIRETLEEAAIIPVVDTSIDAGAALELRAELESTPDAGFQDVISRRKLVLSTADLEPLGRWITPVAESKRFDTRFYLLVLPSRQNGLHDLRETTRSFWASPSEILLREERKEIFLAPPTVHTVELFVGVRTAAEAQDIARRQPLGPICPHLVQDGDEFVLALPGDPLHPEKVAVFDETMPTRFVMRDGRFVKERAR